MFVEVVHVAVGRMYSARCRILKVVRWSAAAAVSHLRLLRLGKVDESAEPVRAALAADCPPDALGELQGGRHVPFRETHSF